MTQARELNVFHMFDKFKKKKKHEHDKKKNGKHKKDPN